MSFSPFVVFVIVSCMLIWWFCQFIFQLMSGLLAASWLKWSGVVCCFQVLIVSLKLDLRPETLLNAHVSGLQPPCPAHNLRHRWVVRDWLLFMVSQETVVNLIGLEMDVFYLFHMQSNPSMICNLTGSPVKGPLKGMYC